MTNIFIPEASLYWTTLAPLLVLFFFFAQRYKLTLRDRAFKKEAEELLDALDAERRRHATLYSVRCEIERRRVFDESDEKNQLPR